jgi:type III restriction enzyme
VRFRFDAGQEHQIAAVGAVRDLFVAGAVREPEAVSHLAPGARGHQGFGLGADAMLRNTKRVQEREGVRVDDRLEMLDETDLRGISRSFPNFSVEMETGTGKTYCYIRTCLRLAEDFGLRKFIIVVHSQAIREGTLKTLVDTEEHFRSELFPDLPYEWGLLGEGASIGDFVEPSDTVRFGVAMVQSFDKPETNLLYREPESAVLFGGGSPIERLAEMRPVLVVDEPQNMATPLRRRALASLNPLFCLRYSATHRERFNLVHRLSARRAHDLGLVKRIAVRGVTAGRDAGQAYVSLVNLRPRKKGITATVRLHEPARDGGVTIAERRVGLGDDLMELTGLDAYEGWVIHEIERDPDRIVLENGTVVEVGGETALDREALWFDQVKETIRTHLERQRDVGRREAGIKVLSLFFVDSVADYAGEEATLPRLFDQAYEELRPLYEGDLELPPAEDARIAYFATDRRGAAKDTGGTQADREAEARAYELIIAHKEELLDASESAAFLFSHSALQEGWDNPNVFQTCFLRNVRSELQRRQQVGRGLRLCVDSTGERVHDPGVNRLTVIVDEGFAEFRDQLVAEYVAARREVGEPFDDTPPLEDATQEITVRRREELFESEAFARLWERIRYRTRYTVQIDEPALVEAVTGSSELADLRGVSRTKNVIEAGEIVFDEEGIPDDESGARSLRAGRVLVRRGKLPDVARLIEDDLYGGSPQIPLTRATIGEIVRLAPRPELAVAQPEQWAAAVSRAIRTVGVEQMIGGIVYEPLPEAEWWEASTIPVSFLWKDSPEPAPGAAWQGALSAAEGSSSLYDWIAHDSKVEREFGKQLEVGERIDLFTKLPRQFKIDTPVGSYSPDWAITIPVDGGQRLVLIRETKATLVLGELPASERLRILAARKHFGLNVAGPVDFVNTTDQAGLRILGESELNQS